METLSGNAPAHQIYKIRCLLKDNGNKRLVIRGVEDFTPKGLNQPVFPTSRACHTFVHVVHRNVTEGNFALNILSHILGDLSNEKVNRQGESNS